MFDILFLLPLIIRLFLEVLYTELSPGSLICNALHTTLHCKLQTKYNTLRSSVLHCNSIIFICTVKYQGRDCLQQPTLELSGVFVTLSYKFLLELGVEQCVYKILELDTIWP